MKFQLALLAAFALTTGVRADDWPQWMGPKRDNVWREDGILDTFPAGGAKIRNARLSANTSSRQRHNLPGATQQLSRTVKLFM